MSLPPLKPVAFVLGVPRSGTTLLRVMLAGHPGLFSPPEMVLAPFETMAERRARLDQRYWEKGGLPRALMELEGIDVDAARDRERELDARTIPEVYASLQERLGGRLLVDKCPHLCAEPAALKRLDEWFPEARWLWILRHPGSVMRSVENMPMAEVMLSGYAEDARDIWRSGNEVIRDFLKGIPPERQATLHYEALVADPRPVMEQACRALGVPFDARVLDPYEGDRMREGHKGARAIGDPNMAGRGRIQPELATAWLEGFDPRGVSAATRELAGELGYDLSDLPLPPLALASQAYAALLQTAQELESRIRLPMDLDATEGRRFLLRLLAASVDLFLEYGDPERPGFHHVEGPTRKMFADCPDADYQRAPIRLGEGRAYRVRGRVPPGTLYVGATFYGRGGKIAGQLSDADIARDSNGRFEIRISAEPADAPAAEGTTLWRGGGEETAVIVRQYFADRAREAPIELAIERLADAPAPRPLDPRQLEKALSRARRNMETVFTRTLDAWKLASASALNRFVEPPAESLFPTPDNRYQVAWFRFGPDQLMLIRGRVPEGRYFGVSLCNVWLESYDYTRHRVNLNHAQIAAEPDGSFELCLAHRDPGHPNWLDTSGHLAGYVIARTLLPGGPAPELSTRVLYEREYAARRRG